MDLRARLKLEKTHGYTDLVASVLSIIPPPPKVASAPAPSGSAQHMQPVDMPATPPSSPIEEDEVEAAPRRAYPPRPAVVPTPTPAAVPAGRKETITGDLEPARAPIAPQLPPHLARDPEWRAWAAYQMANGGQSKIAAIASAAAQAQAQWQQSAAKSAPTTAAAEKQVRFAPDPGQGPAQTTLPQ